MDNTKNIERIERELVMREATGDFRDSSYCKSCGHNNGDNIGKVECVKCGKHK